MLEIDLLIYKNYTLDQNLTCPSFPKKKSIIYTISLQNDENKISYRMMVGTHSIVGVLDVNGLATDASAVDSDIPAWAAFNAPTSLAPSPHIET